MEVLFPTRRGGQTFEQREQARAVHLLAQTSRRRLFEVVGLVDHEVVEVREQAAPDLGVGEQERVVDHDQVRGFGLSAGAVDVALLLRAVDPDTVQRVRRDLRPEHFLAPVKAQL